MREDKVRIKSGRKWGAQEPIKEAETKTRSHHRHDINLGGTQLTKRGEEN